MAKRGSPSEGDRGDTRGGHTFIGKANTTPAVRKALTHSTPYGRGTCSVCGLEVPLRKNGDIGSHRVGSTRKNSWPCAGSTPVEPHVTKEG